MSGETDLFGAAILQPRPLGRPRHVPTPATRRNARVLHAAGLPQLAIAQALGITIPTLVRHYPSEVQSRSQAWCLAAKN